ncbi:MAG: ATP-binding cassette domain-containing protein [Spirochaetia bacterium]|jgi:oligopeptide transport system ATP-binding protein|nr:ATP-binding cassette domain-containing protein [Spirochaetia bacterium]
MSDVLLSVKDLEVTFKNGKEYFTAVRKVNFDIHEGESFALVGESGSGKTTIGRTIIRINPATKGEIFFAGKKISGIIDRELDTYVIRNIQMIFQDPMASLNERATIDYIVSEGLYNFGLFKNENERREKVFKALDEVGLLEEHAERYPHEFSGGQRQRICIARVLAMEPKFIIADEPISALDVSIRAQVLNLLHDLKNKRGLSYLFIAHDLTVVRYFADRIGVIHQGELKELATTEELFARPLHPYTRSLLSAVPMPDPDIEKQKKLILYSPASHDYSMEQPGWREAFPGHFVLANAQEEAEYRAMYA